MLDPAATAGMAGIAGAGAILPRFHALIPADLETLLPNLCEMPENNSCSLPMSLKRIKIMDKEAGGPEMEKKCSEFLNRYNISEEAYAAAGIAWDELEEVRDHYIQTRDELEPTARYIVNILNKTEKVHSVSYRIKAPEHLIAKIIRKRIGKPEGIINLANYRQKITDLIGIRVLHLFKEDWLDLHQFITRTWNLRKEPIAYVRRGDAAGYINSFKNWGCTIKEHPYGYRSVHYLLQSMISESAEPTVQVSEVQVRTLFEEAWSSIDHHVRYPYEPRNVLLNELLVILNRLSGSADEMASCILYLKEKINTPGMPSQDVNGQAGQGGGFFQPLDEFEWPAETGSGVMAWTDGNIGEGVPEQYLSPPADTADQEKGPGEEGPEKSEKPSSSGER